MYIHTTYIYIPLHTYPRSEKINPPCFIPWFPLGHLDGKSHHMSLLSQRLAAIKAVPEGRWPKTARGIWGLNVLPSGELT